MSEFQSSGSLNTVTLKHLDLGGSNFSSLSPHLISESLSRETESGTAEITDQKHSLISRY